MISNRDVKIHRPFGPYVIQTTISDELHTILLSNAKKIRRNKKLKTKNDYRKRLAGNLKEEYSYTDVFTKEENIKVREELTWLASVYTINSEKAINKNFSLKPNEINMLEPVWVNFMKSSEWNPAHSHTGDISCVIYLQVPEEIAQENKTSKSSNSSNTPSAGRIEFTYGDNIGFSNSGLMFQPQEKQIFLFPAKLKHMVYPFKAKTERISVSVNFANKITSRANLAGDGQQFVT